jgi:nucleoside 2-deoxyribosyltransferase
VDKSKTQPFIYVAGPYRGGNSWDTEQNIRKAEAVGMECVKAGFAVHCPHTNFRFGEGWLPDPVWLQADITVMRRCDAVMVCPGWEQSSGTKAEIAIAMQDELPVFYDLRDMAQHFAGRLEAVDHATCA